MAAVSQGVNWKPLMAALGLPEPETEYAFHPDRKWRFDYAWPKEHVALEREGGTWHGGRHTHGAGYRNDCQKYNAAQLLGWVVIRATADMMESGEAIRAVEKAIAMRQRERSSAI
jgi:hypothetical protein